MRNWSPSNIFDVRGKTVVDKTGKAYKVELFASGWSIGDSMKMDIWEACAMLNHIEAK